MRMPTIRASTPEVRHDRAARGVLDGVIPLAVAMVWVAITLGAVALARQMTAGQGFITEQATAMIIALVGLVLTTLCFAASCVFVLLHVRAWLRAGAPRQAAGALWTLAVVAVVVVLPVILANTIPRYP